jgi:hypothetical protein
LLHAGYAEDDVAALAWCEAALECGADARREGHPLPFPRSPVALAFDAAEIDSRQALFGLVCTFADVALLVGVHDSRDADEATCIAAIVSRRPARAGAIEISP